MMLGMRLLLNKCLITLPSLLFMLNQTTGYSGRNTDWKLDLEDSFLRQYQLGCAMLSSSLMGNILVGRNQSQLFIIFLLEAFLLIRKEM